MNYSFIFVFSGFIFTQGPAVPENCLESMFVGSISQTPISHWLGKEKVPNLCTAISHSHSASHHEEPTVSSSSSEEDLHFLIPTKKYSKIHISLTKEPIWIQGDTFLPAVISPDQSLTAETSTFSKEDTSFPLGLCKWKCLWWRNQKHRLVVEKSEASACGGEIRSIDLHSSSPKREAWESVIEEHGLDRVAKLTPKKKKLYYRIQTRDSMVSRFRNRYMTV